MAMIYYEVRSLGKWGPRVTYLNSPTPGEYLRAIQDVRPEHQALSLRALWEVYSPDSPRNRPEGSAPAQPDPAPDPAPPAGVAEAPAPVDSEANQPV